MLFTARALLILDLLEEVVAFIIDEDKRRKIFHFDFPDSFHPQFRIGHALEALDTLLGEHCRRAADASKVEAAVFMASVTCWLRLPFASITMLAPWDCSRST